VTYLLDINVLVALFDPAHVHHEAAHRWFAAVGSNSWATCPITENGFIRVLSNPGYPTVSADIDEITDRLRALISQSGHEFWSDEISMCDSSRFDASHLSGHKQITDLHLAGLAAHRRGKLATFDGSIPVSALVAAPAVVVEVIPTT
jgi:toxin-antitoxin system PIN domain toxin